MNNIALCFFQVKEIFWVERTARCPCCGAVSKRHSKGERTLIDIDLDTIIFLHCVVGVYHCPNGCGYFRTELPFAPKGARYTYRAREKCTLSVEEDKMPISAVPERVARDFNIRPAVSTVHRWYNEKAEQLDLFHDYYPWVVASFSGVLCVDEVYDKNLCLLLATDPLNKKTIAYRLCGSATKEDVKGFLDHLRTIGIDPEVVVTDGSTLYPETIKEIYPRARHQLCLFHVVRNITKDVLKAVLAYRKSLPKPPKRKKGRPRKGEEVSQNPSPSKVIKDNRYLIVTRPEHLDAEKEEILMGLLAEHQQLELFRNFTLDVYNLFDQPTKEQAVSIRAKMEQNPLYTENEHLKRALDRLSEENLQKVLVYKAYENLNPTNNDVERAARTFRKRQKAHYRLRGSQAVDNMMKLELMRQKRFKERMPQKTVVLTQKTRQRVSKVA